MKTSVIGLGGIGSIKRKKSSSDVYVFSVSKFHENYYGPGAGEWVIYPRVKVKRSDSSSASNFAKTKIPWPFHVQYDGMEGDNSPGFDYGDARSLTDSLAAKYRSRIKDEGPVKDRRVKF